jgi:hypothetical protein
MTQEFHFVDVGGLRYSHDRDPDICPLCHYSVRPDQECWSLLRWRREEAPKLEIVFRCPRAECGRLFIARYEPSTEQGSGGRTLGLFVLSELVPRTPKPPGIPDEVKALSQGFVEIYTEAAAAESFGLREVAGVGFRKALEFLIKDYCIHVRPNSQNEITKENSLGECIKKFVDDPKVKECARRATWLGNDETHYSRRWLDKDITDLKILIQLTVTWIHSSELTKRYLSEMA